MAVSYEIPQLPKHLVDTLTCTLAHVKAETDVACFLLAITMTGSLMQSCFEEWYFLPTILVSALLTKSNKVMANVDLFVVLRIIHGYFSANTFGPFYLEIPSSYCLFVTGALYYYAPTLYIHLTSLCNVDVDEISCKWMFSLIIE